MNYKSIIKNRKLRNQILRLLAFIPDKAMLQIQYFIKFNRRLNLNNPKRFTEKLQWYKLNCRSPLMQQCVNKYQVRKYIEECGFHDILIPIIGIYNSPSEINFDKLPKSFVIKDTLGGGGNEVIIVKNKINSIKDNLYKTMYSWTKKPISYKTGGREWPYGNQKHQILIEQYLPSNPLTGGLIDYKFFCSYGKIKILYVIADRQIGKKAGFGIFTPNWEKLPVVRCDEKPLARQVNKPAQYETMCKIAEKLSEPFPEVRIDLYFTENKIYFGEITFFDGSGYMSFEPDSFDFQMGKLFPLNNKITHKP